jgi:hypothetical protein
MMPGKKPAGGAEQETQQVERSRVAHEGHADRHQPPGQHDAADPGPGAHARQDEVARDFEQRVRHEEDARPEAVDRRREAEVAVHVEGREADVHAVEVGDDVEQEQERDEAPAQGRDGSDGGGRGRRHAAAIMA